MDLKVAFVIICLCALAITSTEGIPKCCITTKKFIPGRLLRKVQRYEMQKDSGACDITALILHIKGLSRPVCADPQVLERMISLSKKIKLHKYRTH
ncbi:C-C motif chemokine 27a [Sparus aurata]|nr:C-C motif chemokine 28 [Sparus aurata]